MAALPITLIGQATTDSSGQTTFIGLAVVTGLQVGGGPAEPPLGIWGGRPPLYPDQGLPGPQPRPPGIWGGAPPYVDIGGPGSQPGPDQGLPGPQPGGGAGAGNGRWVFSPVYGWVWDPGQGGKPQPPNPGQPPRPGQGLPPTSPPRPDQGLPGSQPGIDQGLPGGQPGIDQSLPAQPLPDQTHPEPL
jgi:hypothetical protein